VSDAQPHSPPVEDGGGDDLRTLLALAADACFDWHPRAGTACFLELGGAPPPFVAVAEAAPDGAAVHPEDRPGLVGAVDTFLAGRSATLDARYRLRLASGGWQLVRSRARPVARDERGTVLRALGTLECVVPGDEAAERAEQRLRQVQRLDALGQLAGGIAHDFNNILASVLGHAELALLDSEDGEGPAQTYLREIRSAADRGRDLIAQLLRFSRGEVEGEPRAATVETLHATLRMLRPILPATLAVDVHCDPSVRGVALAPTQLQQLVLNLAINARDALGENGRIRVSVTPAPAGAFHCDACGAEGVLREGAERVLLRVADDGPGIPPEVLPHVFDPFFTTKGEREGSGLGLAVVRSIVHEHGGHVGLVSNADGTEFSLLLPALAEPTVVAGVAVHSEARPPVGQGQRLLVVDDEPSIGRWMARLLTRHGFAVEVETDPRRALERVRDDAEPFDLVLTDQSMPHLSGVELADELLALRAGLPIVVCSGYSEFVGPENAEELGFRQFLAKPVPGSTLVATVCEALGMTPPA
jgi:signal transduction histidine kinase